MTDQPRRQFLKLAGAAAALTTFPPSIQRALVLDAARTSGTIVDVQHVVILMLENHPSTTTSGRCAGCGAFAIVI